MFIVGRWLSVGNGTADWLKGVVLLDCSPALCTTQQFAKGLRYDHYEHAKNQTSLDWPSADVEPFCLWASMKLTLLSKMQFGSPPGFLYLLNTLGIDHNGGHSLT